MPRCSCGPTTRRRSANSRRRTRSLMSAIQFWDNMYRDLTAPTMFGNGQPSASVAAAAGRLPRGARVLDVGCGDGRNVLYLASLGYHVTALDISPVAIAKVQQFAAERGLTVDAAAQDLREMTFDADYDLIVSMGCLHWVAREAWESFLREAQAHTRVGGFHAIGVFTDALPAPEDQRDFYLGLFAQGELFTHYADWEIISQDSTQFHDEHPGGVRHHHACDTILARRV